MITEAQKQQFKLKGYDKLIVSRGEIIAINTRGVKDWNSKSKESFLIKQDCPFSLREMVILFFMIQDILVFTPTHNHHI